MTTDLEKNLGLRNSKFHFPEFEGEKALLYLKDESAFKNRQRTLKTEASFGRNQTTGSRGVQFAHQFS